tara:strand:- start:2265 stop:2690 length:426 start_codon:yes stop_codon:yes gene_type:complete
MGCGCNKTNTNKTKPTYANKVNTAINKAQPINSKTGFNIAPEAANVASEAIQTPKKSPSLFQKALNLGEALANHVADGMEKVSKKQMATRLSVCQRCPFLAGSECTKCGCNLSVKASWRSSECPDKRWPIFAYEGEEKEKD